MVWPARMTRAHQVKGVGQLRPELLEAGLPLQVDIGQRHGGADQRPDDGRPGYSAGAGRPAAPEPAR